MKKFYFAFGEKGVIKPSLIPTDEVNIGEMHIEFSPDKMLPKQSSLYPRPFSITDPRCDTEFTDVLWQRIQSIYSDWGNFGKFGDVFLISKTQEEGFYYFDVVMIGWLEFPKPVLAVDILPFVSSGDGKVYFVGGVKNKTGKKKAVLSGGIRDVNGFYFESAFETMVREAREEMGINITVADLSAGFSLGDLNASGFFADVCSANPEIFSQYSGVVERLGDYWTSDHEKHLATESKRVHLTSAFRLRIAPEAGKVLTPTSLSDFFQAGDDLCELFFWDISKGTPDFPSAHHKEIYENAVKTIHVI